MSGIVTCRCLCGKYKELNHLFWCRDCDSAVCDECVDQEIVYHYCPQCRNPSSASSVGNLQGRCDRCFKCPLCFSSATFLIKNSMYYLNCNMCSWNSPQVERFDLTGSSASQVITAFQNFLKDGMEEQVKMDQIFNDIKEVQNKQTAEKEKFSRRKFGTIESTERSAMVKSIKEIDEEIERKRDQDIYEPVDMPEPDFVDLHPNLEEISTWKQRIQFPILQQKLKKDLIPQRVLLTNKTMKLCHHCNTRLVRPDADANKATFARIRLAYDHLAVLSIISVPTDGFPLNEPMHLVCCISNFTGDDLETELIPEMREGDTALMSQEYTAKFEKEVNIIDPSLLSSIPSPYPNEIYFNMTVVKLVDSPIIKFSLTQNTTIHSNTENAVLSTTNFQFVIE